MAGLSGVQVKSNGGIGFFKALALFAMLCGAILLFVGSSDGIGASTKNQSQMKQVLNEIDAAANALEATDYGKTRERLKKAREKLSKMTQ